MRESMSRATQNPPPLPGFARWETLDPLLKSETVQLTSLFVFVFSHKEPRDSVNRECVCVGGRCVGWCVYFE